VAAAGFTISPTLSAAAASASPPWYRRVCRWGQINISKPNASDNLAAMTPAQVASARRVAADSDKPGREAKLPVAGKAVPVSRAGLWIEFEIPQIAMHELAVIS